MTTKLPMKYAFGGVRAEAPGEHLERRADTHQQTFFTVGAFLDRLQAYFVSIFPLRYALNQMGRQCEFFTMMRHPIDRAISACEHKLTLEGS